MLRVEPGELDLHALEQRAAAGRAALAQGDPGQAAALLVVVVAESLLRGRPLADLEFEPFARPPSPRSSQSSGGKFQPAKMVMVGDRGMITKAMIEALKPPKTARPGTGRTPTGGSPKA